MKLEPNLPERAKRVENSQAVSTSENLESERGTNWRHFNPNVKVTEKMMWHPHGELMHRTSSDQNPQNDPTWASLFWKVVLGFAEVLMPLALREPLKTSNFH